MENSYSPIPSNINPSLAASTKQTVLSNPLLHAWHDPLAGLKTNSHCIKLADLNCDGH